MKKRGINMKKWQIINIILIILWMIIIFLFSSANGIESEHQSDVIIIKTAEIINKEKIPEENKQKLIDKYIVLVRKSAHFFLYFILGILVYLFVHKKYNTSLKTFIIMIIVCTLYAISDEIHQLFTLERAAEVRDVFIDMGGSLLAEILLTIIFVIKDKIKKKEVELK
jgi:VanZ family protein